MQKVFSIAGAVALVLLATSGAYAAPAPRAALAPIRSFIAVVPETPWPLVSLRTEEREHLRRVVEAPAAPTSLDSLRPAGPTPIGTRR